MGKWGPRLRSLKKGSFNKSNGLNLSNQSDHCPKAPIRGDTRDWPACVPFSKCCILLPG